MIKNKLDFKLINFAILIFIIYLMCQTSPLWLGIVIKAITILAPFFFGFVVAYALNPCVRFLINKGLPKWLSILLILLLIAGILVTVIILAGPLLFNQLSSLFTGITSFFKEISSNFDLNFVGLQETLSKSFSNILSNLGQFVSNGAINFIGVSLSFLSALLVGVSASIYFLIDMDSIRRGFKKIIKRKSTKVYKYVSLLDEQMKKYLTGFLKILVINLFMYSFVFFIAGHPNALLLGFLASIASIVPYFGGIFTNLIALVTAFVISPALFVKTLIAVIVLSVLDGNVISPLVYGKTNQLHPLLIILVIFTGGLLFGAVGIILALPLSIIIVTTIKYFKPDITGMIGDIKDDKKKQK